MKISKLERRHTVKLITFLCSVFLLIGCEKEVFERPTFKSDLEFLTQKIDPIVLKDTEERQIIVSAEFQGKVMSSTSKGVSGFSYGWFNKGIISSDTVFYNRSKVGSEGRIWFGPDQGPNTIFFKINKETKEVEHAAPKDLDTLPFNVFNKTEKSVLLGNKLHIKNLKGFHFYIDVKRQIDILPKGVVESNLKIDLNTNIDFVAFKTETSMQNVGLKNWSKESGLLSLWDLGCFYPTPNTTVIIPLKGEAKKATVYFTPLASTRIKIKDDVLFYRADANYLNKIGTLPEHTRPCFGSYSPELNLLTIVKFSFNNDMDYVNAHPENINEQYRGDVINVFNDGVIGDIGPFGPFYELETSSPAKALRIGESLKHSHETYHFEGSRKDLNKISETILNVNLDSLEMNLSGTPKD